MHVLGPILWLLVVYAGAVTLHLLGDAVPPLYVALVGAAVSLLAPVPAVFKRFSFLLMAAVTAFLTWTTATTPFARNPALAAAAGAAVFGMSYHALRNHEAKVADADVLATKAATKGRYVDLLETVGLKGLKEGGQRRPFPTGKTVPLLLPVDGKIDLDRLKNSVGALEIASARAGLNVRYDFERGSNAGEVLLHVFEDDILAQEIPIPFDRRQKSINDPMPLGVYATGEVCVVTFREVAALMVGLKGRGKSGLINTHLAHLTGCSDAVVWMLDGKSGETVRPWLEPFLEMVTDKPVIDWPAVDEAEFDAVLLAADAVRRFRSGTKRRWSPTAQTPSVILIVEEASVITGVSRYGAHQRVQLAQDAVTLGRSSLVDSIFATQRATLDMLGSGAMKANLDLRYGMGITEAADARMIFPDGKMAQALFRLGDDPVYRGTFLMQAPGNARIMPAKGYWVDPDTIPGIARTNAQWAGTLDDETASYVHKTLVAAGVPGGYFGRWDRLGKTLGVHVPGGTIFSAGTSQASRPASQDRPSETAETSQSYDGSKGRQAVQDAVAASRAKRDAETFDALVSANFKTHEMDGFDPETGDARPEEPFVVLENVGTLPEGVPPILRSVLAVFRGRGNEAALPSRVICEHLPGEMTPKALSLLMSHCNVSPIQNLIWEGKSVRGYSRDAVETSVKRGSWNDQAFKWQP